jgi:hypothetical protein
VIRALKFQISNFKSLALAFQRAPRRGAIRALKSQISNFKSLALAFQRAPRRGGG